MEVAKLKKKILLLDQYNKYINEYKFGIIGMPISNISVKQQSVLFSPAQIDISIYSVNKASS